MPSPSILKLTHETAAMNKLWGVTLAMIDQLLTPVCIQTSFSSINCLKINFFHCNPSCLLFHNYKNHQPAIFNGKRTHFVTSKINMVWPHRFLWIWSSALWIFDASESDRLWLYKWLWSWVRRDCVNTICHMSSRMVSRPYMFMKMKDVLWQFTYHTKQLTREDFDLLPTLCHLLVTVQSPYVLLGSLC